MVWNAGGPREEMLTMLTMREFTRGKNERCRLSVRLLRERGGIVEGGEAQTFRQVRERGFGQQESSTPVEIHKSVPVFERLFLQREVNGKRSIIDKDIDLAILFRRSVRERVRTSSG
jgi:hypothetical protein